MLAAGKDKSIWVAEVLGHVQPSVIDGARHVHVLLAGSLFGVTITLVLAGETDTIRSIALFACLVAWVI